MSKEVIRNTKHIFQNNGTHIENNIHDVEFPTSELMINKRSKSDRVTGILERNYYISLTTSVCIISSSILKIFLIINLIYLKMDREEVVSSNLASIGYNKQTSILEIEFKHGGIYQYECVPSVVYEALINAESHGKYFSAHIKNNYKFVKLWILKST